MKNPFLIGPTLYLRPMEKTDAALVMSLSLSRVWLKAYQYNPAGLRAYENVGFQKEGVLRQGNFREGRYWDTIIMGLLREDWDKYQGEPPGGCPKGESAP
jgi:hypothetical protein